MKTCARFTCLGVVALAVTLTLKPEVVLHLPNGFIPYAILGHPPPAFFSFDGWNDIDNWAMPGDLIVSGGAKCGTNWLLYMAHLIRVKANVAKYPFEEVMLNTPWPTLVHEPGQSWADISEKMNTTVLADGSRLKDKWDNKAYPFRVFKAHERPESATINGRDAVLPVRRRRDLKFIVSIRSPYDILRSFYPFFASHKPEFRRRWGDFPPVYSDKNSMLDDMLEGGKLAHLIWDWAKTWYDFKDDPNVLIVAYEKMLKDPRGHVAKISKFLGVDLTEEEIDTITHMTDFAEMKKIGGRFNYVLWANSQDPTQVVMIDGKLLRKGKKGGGSSFFNDEEKARIQRNMDKEWSAEVKAWMGLETLN